MSADLGAQKEKSRENVLDTRTGQLVLCGDEVQRVEVLLSSTSRVLLLKSASPEKEPRPRPGLSASSLKSCKCSSSRRRSSISYTQRRGDMEDLTSRRSRCSVGVRGGGANGPLRLSVSPQPLLQTLFCSRLLVFQLLLELMDPEREPMSRGRSTRWFESRRLGWGCWERSPAPPLRRSPQTAPRSERPRKGLIGPSEVSDPWVLSTALSLSDSLSRPSSATSATSPGNSWFSGTRSGNTRVHMMARQSCSSSTPCSMMARGERVSSHSGRP
ncbi:hypothetical protein EYF80_018788 [Liparis tanakae]|uniref:Uncharacterized protein n=1 Tax=Liparis tanakae TaxID=230148 RepID=A0A4Z2I155_9TELE|nr:hypothetical protein EYF80_018788 [Liparis tanakae]